MVQLVQQLGSDATGVEDATGRPLAHSSSRTEDEQMSGASSASHGKRLRVLWLADSFGRAEREARIGSFADSLKPSGLDIELLVLTGRPPGQLAPTADAGRRVKARSLEAGDRLTPSTLFRLVRTLKQGDYDLVHSHFSLAASWGAVAARYARVPFVATLYGTGDRDESGAVEAKLERRAIKSLQRSCRRVIAISGLQWDRFVRDRLFPRPMLEVVHPGIDTEGGPEPNTGDRQRLRKKADFPADALVATTIASLDDRRSGIDLLLWAIPEMIAAVPELRFVIVGSGSGKKELGRRMRARGLNRYIYWLDQAGDEIQGILAGSDFFIHPSLGEPFPFAVLEAMAAGLPVVATRAGGAPEILGTEGTGRLVPTTDPGALAKTVIELAAEPERLVRMGMKGQARARQKFSADRWVRELEEIYRDVVAEVESGAASRPWPHTGLSVKLLGGRPEGAH